jgi:hypothetical protein
LLQSTSLNISLDEAIVHSQKTSSFLEHMLGMIEPQQVKSNEIARVRQREREREREREG